MTVSREVETEIRVLHFGEHLPVGTIARQLTVHEDVVKRVLGLLEPRAPAAPRALLVDPYRDFIDQTLRQYPTLRATRLYDMVQRRGYPGSVRTLREYVHEVRPAPAPESLSHLGRVETLAFRRPLQQRVG